MTSQPTRPTTRGPSSDEDLRKSTVGELKPHAATIRLVDYDPAWPGLFEREAARIRGVLGERVLRTRAHRIDVRPRPRGQAADRHDPRHPRLRDEASYVPDLEAAGYKLWIREPDWYEHRVFKGPDTNINLHVFSPGSPELERMVRFRDWLRTHDEDRELYERTKRELAAREWRSSSTMPTQRPRSSRSISLERRPSASSVDIEAAHSATLRPRMSRYFYFRCPA